MVVIIGLNGLPGNPVYDALRNLGLKQGSTAERYLAIYINIFTYICLIFVPVFIDVHFICSFTENP